MSRHSVLCRNSGVRHYVTTRLCARDKDTLSRQCGATLRRDKEGSLAHTKDQGYAHTTELLCRDRLGTLVKKKPQDWGVTI